MTQVRRSRVLAGAQSAFFELGLEGASLREIAHRAGYSPGAIYSYFASKEEVYGALLGESLERLNAFVEAAEVATAKGRTVTSRLKAAEAPVRAKATAFFEFYLNHPRDLDLGFYLFKGMKPRGLTPSLNERLNARLGDALEPVRRGLITLGATGAQAQGEVTALFAHVVGLLVLSHTGRIRMFRQDPQALFERYLGAMLARSAKAATRLAA